MVAQYVKQAMFGTHLIFRGDNPPSSFNSSKPTRDQILPQVCKQDRKKWLKCLTDFMLAGYSILASHYMI